MLFLQVVIDLDVAIGPLHTLDEGLMTGKMFCSRMNVKLLLILVINGVMENDSLMRAFERSIVGVELRP